MAEESGPASLKNQVAVIVTLFGPTLYDQVTNILTSVANPLPTFFRLFEKLTYRLFTVQYKCTPVGKK